MHNYVIERKWTLMISQNMHLQRPTQRSRVGHDVFTLVVFPVPAGNPKIEVQQLESMFKVSPLGLKPSLSQVWPRRVGVAEGARLLAAVCWIAGVVSSAAWGYASPRLHPMPQRLPAVRGGTAGRPVFMASGAPHR